MVSAAISGMTTGAIGSAGFTTSQKSVATGVDFKQIFSTSVSNNTANTTSDNSTESIKQAETTVEKKDVDVTKSSDKTTKSVDNKKSDKEEIKDAVKEAATDVKDEIKDKLEVTDEEIADAMAQLGMTFVDLLDPQKVTELVKTLKTGDDPISFLTSSDAFDDLGEILDVVGEQLDKLAAELDEPVENVKEDLATIKVDDSDTKTFFVGKEVTPETKEIKDEPKNAENNQGNGLDELGDAFAKKLTVETSTSHNSNEKMMDKKETAQDFNHIAGNLSASVTEAFADIVTTDAQMVNEVDIVRQVIDQVKVTANEQLQSIEVMLNPENLGSVHVTVTAKEGTVTAQLTAQNEQVKAALENQMISLKEHFNNQGIKVEAVEISVASHGFESNPNLEGNDSNQAQEERKTSRRLDLSSLDDLDDSELTVDELRAKDSIVNGNSSVEYSA